MSLITRRRSVVAASLSLGTVSALALLTAVLGACSSSDGGTPAADGAVPLADASDAAKNDAADAATSLLAFQPSNVDLSAIDTSKIGDEDITGDCEISTDGTGDCFTDGNLGTAQVLQSDGTKVTVIILKSLRIEAAAHVTLKGGLPLVLVTTGDMTILGSFDAGGEGDTGVAGGFTQSSTQNAKGSGPGAGPAATGAAESTPGLGAGGGSFCGLGGIGGAEMDATGTQTATPAYGSADLRPLMPGSSGGNGAAGGAGAGGGALQFVAGGTFTMNAGSSINVGGGGGNFGGTGGQNAGGGGAGGAVLIEATTASIAGTIAANGGGGGAGGGGSDGSDGMATSTVTAGGTGSSLGGAGGAGDTAGGAAGQDVAGTSAGGGGGGAGRIRINTSSGTASTSNATISPSLTPASGSTCSSIGTVRALGSGV